MSDTNWTGGGDSTTVNDPDNWDNGVPGNNSAGLSGAEVDMNGASISGVTWEGAGVLSGTGTITGGTVGSSVFIDGPTVAGTIVLDGGSICKSDLSATTSGGSANITNNGTGTINTSGTLTGTITGGGNIAGGIFSGIVTGVAINITGGTFGAAVDISGTDSSIQGVTCNSTLTASDNTAVGGTFHGATTITDDVVFTGICTSTLTVTGAASIAGGNQSSCTGITWNSTGTFDETGGALDLTATPITALKAITIEDTGTNGITGSPVVTFTDKTVAQASRDKTGNGWVPVYDFGGGGRPRGR